MNRRYKNVWLRALRSGEYAQGRRQLCRVRDDREHEFCCLGVLVNETEGFDRLPQYPVAYARADGDAFGFSDRLMKKFGLTKDHVGQLISRNDGRQWSFNKIADWIEKTL